MPTRSVELAEEEPGGFPKKSRRVVLYADLPAEMLNVNPEVHTARMLKYLSRPR